MGLALLPNWLIEEDLQAGTLINAFPDYDVTATDFSTAAWLVYPTRAYVPLKVLVFLDFSKAVLLLEVIELRPVCHF